MTLISDVKAAFIEGCEIFTDPLDILIHVISKVVVDKEKIDDEVLGLLGVVSYLEMMQDNYYDQKKLVLRSSFGCYTTFTCEEVGLYQLILDVLNDCGYDESYIEDVEKIVEMETPCEASDEDIAESTPPEKEVFADVQLTLLPPSCVKSKKTRRSRKPRGVSPFTLRQRFWIEIGADSKACAVISLPYHNAILRIGKIPISPQYYVSAGDIRIKMIEGCITAIKNAEFDSQRIEAMKAAEKYFRSFSR